MTWLLSVFTFLQILSIVQLNILFITVIILNIFLILNKFVNVIYLLPFAIILSPIFGSISFFNLNFLFSDFLLIFSIIVLLFIKNRTLIKSKNIFYFFLILFVHFYLHYALGDLISLKPIISIIQIFIVYCLSISCLSDFKINRFLTTTIIAVFIGSILMFGAFYLGINQNDFQGNASNLTVNAKEFDVTDYRMTFFYTTFPFLISISIFILLYKLKEVSNKLIKIGIFIGIILLCLFLIASGNKTSMASVIVVFIISMIYYNRSFFSYLKKISFVIFTFFILTSLLFNYYLNDLNTERFIFRMLSFDSLEDRFGVYLNAWYVFIQNPLYMIIGYGPDFLTCCGEQTLAESFKYNYYTKDLQGAVDSGIITFLIEFGLIISIVIIYFLINTLMRLIRNSQNINILLVQIILLLIISGTTQVIGLSKISWFFVIIFAISRNLNNVLSIKYIKKNVNIL